MTDDNVVRLTSPATLIDSVRRDIMGYSIDMAIQILAVLREQYVTLALESQARVANMVPGSARDTTRGRGEGYANAYKLVDAAIADLRQAEVMNERGEALT